MSLLIVLTCVLKHRVLLLPQLVVLTCVLEHWVLLSPKLIVLTRVLEHQVLILQPLVVLTRILEHQVPLSPPLVVPTPFLSLRCQLICSSTLTQSARRLLCASALHARRNALGSATEFNMSTIIVTEIVLWCVESGVPVCRCAVPV